MKPLLKILYRLYRLFAWISYAAPRRFTRAGLGILTAIAVCAMMVPDTDNNLSYQGFPLLLSLLLLPLGFCFFFRGRFSVSRRLPRFGTVGALFNYGVGVRNLSRQPQAALTLLEDLADPRPSFAEWTAVQLADERRSFRFRKRSRPHPFKTAVIKEALVPPLAPGAEAEARVEVLPLRRGPLRLSGVTLARPDPLGIIRAFARQPLPDSILILPKRYRVPPVALPGSRRYQLGGVALASSVGQSEEFVSLRDYRNGDPLRHIHWRSWAKAGKPVVKEFEDEFFVRHALVLDTFTDWAGGEAFEEAVAVAASFACQLQTQESLLDLLFVGSESYCLTAGRGLGGADQMLEVLASVQPCTRQPFETLERLVLNHASLVSGCVCVLLAWDKPRRDFVEKLNRLGVPTLVLVVLEPGHRQPVDLGPMMQSPQYFQVLEAGRIEEGLARL